METIKLLDVVALMKDVPEKRLKKGQVGTIVEQWTDQVFEVEFADKSGRTIAFLAAEEKDLMRLYFEPHAA
ncbi:MAG: DUF4926 domain-containing protein [Bacteroidia bacterium]|nr:DUF4926 domain-containing protein [Bacteroidia bacterium]